MILPVIFVFYSTYCIGYVYNTRSESQIISPNWFPTKQQIFINKKVKYGNIDPENIVAYLDDFENNFHVSTIET